MLHHQRPRASKPSEASTRRRERGVQAVRRALEMGRGKGIGRRLGARRERVEGVRWVW